MWQCMSISCLVHFFNILFHQNFDLHMVIIMIGYVVVCILPLCFPRCFVLIIVPQVPMIEKQIKYHVDYVSTEHHLLLWHLISFVLLELFLLCSKSLIIYSVDSGMLSGVVHALTRVFLPSNWVKRYMKLEKYKIIYQGRTTNSPQKDIE